MASRRRTPEDEQSTRRPPATTPDARENQVVSLAMDLAEKQLREGTASSQVITHFLKLGTAREELEREKLTRENTLLAAKSEALESHKATEELFREALTAMRSYSGDPTPVDNYDD